MRRLMFVLLTLWASGCTNDYGEFRYPKGTTGTTADAGAIDMDAGHDAAATD